MSHPMAPQGDFVKVEQIDIMALSNEQLRRLIRKANQGELLMVTLKDGDQVTTTLYWRGERV